MGARLTFIQYGISSGRERNRTRPRLSDHRGGKLTNGNDDLTGKAVSAGRNLDGVGVNFSLYSEAASGVELCLFDETGAVQTQAICLRECTGHIWHCYIPGLNAGQLYGYRIYGPYDPERGLRF